MAIPKNSMQDLDAFDIYCDRGMVFALCAAIFVLPASIALLESFSGLAILIYLIKKINRMIRDWSIKSYQLNFLAKIRFILIGFSPVQNILSLPLIFLTLAIFISVVFSQYPGLSIVAFVGKFLKCVFLYFSFVESFTKERRIMIFLNAFLLSAFIAALSGVVQHQTGKDFLKGRLLGVENFVVSQRISSAFYSANGFGAYLLPVIGIGMHFLFTVIKRRKSWVLAALLILFLALILTCLCWTYSRSSWVGFFIILISMVIFDRRKVLLTGIFILVLILVFLPSFSKVRDAHNGNDNNVKKFQEYTSVVDLGSSGRLSYWHNAVSIVRTSPIYGTGLNTYFRIIKRNPDRRNWWYAHNCYLQLAAETGLLGLGCFLWFLFVLLKNGIDCCFKTKDTWLLTIIQGAVCSLIGFLVQSLFDNTFYTVQLSVLMWLFFGLTVAVIQLKTPSEI